MAQVRQSPTTWLRHMSGATRQAISGALGGHIKSLSGRVRRLLSRRAASRSQYVRLDDMAGLQHDDAALAGLSEAKAAGELADALEKQKLGSDRDGSDYVASVHDGIHDGLTLATEEDKETLRRVPDAVPWSSYRTSEILPSPRLRSHRRTHPPSPQ